MLASSTATSSEDGTATPVLSNSPITPSGPGATDFSKKGSQNQQGLILAWLLIGLFGIIFLGLGVVVCKSPRIFYRRKSQGPRSVAVTEAGGLDTNDEVEQIEVVVDKADVADKSSSPIVSSAGEGCPKTATPSTLWESGSTLLRPVAALHGLGINMAAAPTRAQSLTYTEYLMEPSRFPTFKPPANFKDYHENVQVEDVKRNITSQESQWLGYDHVSLKSVGKSIVNPMRDSRGKLLGSKFSSDEDLSQRERSKKKGRSQAGITSAVGIKVSHNDEDEQEKGGALSQWWKGMLSAKGKEGEDGHQQEDEKHTPGKHPQRRWSQPLLQPPPLYQPGPRRYVSHQPPYGTRPKSFSLPHFSGLADSGAKHRFTVLTSSESSTTSGVVHLPELAQHTSGVVTPVTIILSEPADDTRPVSDPVSEMTLVPGDGIQRDSTVSSVSQFGNGEDDRDTTEREWPLR